MARYKLKDRHPFHQKVQQLFNLADELGISIAYFGNSATLVKDRETGQQYRLEDIETNEPFVEFPAMSEFKLTFNKDESPSPTNKQQ